MRIYNSNIPPMKLTESINDSIGEIKLDYGGFPTIVEGTDTLTLVIDPETTKEEIVTVIKHDSGSLTAKVTRASESTLSIGHSADAVVKHMVTARDLQEPHLHINASTYATNGSKVLHGLGTSDGAVVGTTKSQTLTGKTINSDSNTITIAQSRVSGLTEALAAKATVTSVESLDTAKAPKANPTFTGNVVMPSTTTIGNVGAQEISYLDGLGQAITLTFAGFETRLDDLESIDHRVKVGTASVSVGAGAATSLDVTFSTPFPSGTAPTIILSLTSAHSAATLVSSSSATVDGFRYRGYCANAATITVNYLAVQI